MIDIITSTKNQTPIEVALQLDKDGMTTAKKLYVYLELHPAHYAKWCKKNILGNQYAEESIDFTPFTLRGECGGQATTDYKLTAAFAKKLAMAAGGERGEEAKNYFLKCEEALKQVATVVQSGAVSNMNNITFMKAVVAELETQKSDIASLDERVAKIENTKNIDIIDVTPKNTAATKYTRNNVYSPTSIAKAFGIGAATLNEILSQEGIIERIFVHHEASGNDLPYWRITNKYKSMRYSAQAYAGCKNKTIKPIEITYGWTARGVAYIVNLLKFKGYTQYGEINNKTKSRNWKKGKATQ